MSDTISLPVLLCKCGQPAHPVYQGRCEDCWANHAQTLYGETRTSMVERIRLMWASKRGNYSEG